MLLKKYSDFGGGKKNNLIRSFCHNLMLISGKKFRAMRDKEINILTLVLSEKFFMNERKTYTPPFKLNGRSLTNFLIVFETPFLFSKLQKKLVGFSPSSIH